LNLIYNVYIMEESLGRYLIPFLSNEALISSGNSPLTDTAYIPG